MTPDGSPFIGRTPLRDLYLNGGWCYQGFKATPATGWCLAHTIAHETEHPLIRHLFRLDRFEGGANGFDEYGIGLWTYRQERCRESPALCAASATTPSFATAAMRPRCARRTAAADLKSWYEHVFLFDNPKGAHREFWQHVQGCRQWLVLERDT